MSSSTKEVISINVNLEIENLRDKIDFLSKEPSSLRTFDTMLKLGGYLFTLRYHVNFLINNDGLEFPSFWDYIQKTNLSLNHYESYKYLRAYEIVNEIKNYGLSLSPTSMDEIDLLESYNEDQIIMIWSNFINLGSKNLELVIKDIKEFNDNFTNENINTTQSYLSFYNIILDDLVLSLQDKLAGLENT